MSQTARIVCTGSFVSVNVRYTTSMPAWPSSIARKRWRKNQWKRYSRWTSATMSIIKWNGLIATASPTGNKSSKSGVSSKFGYLGPIRTLSSQYRYSRWCSLLSNSPVISSTSSKNETTNITRYIRSIWRHKCFYPNHHFRCRRTVPYKSQPVY